MTFKELKERGFINETSNDELLEELIENEKITFYLGIDPTADSMHIGHFFPLVLVQKLQKMGHTPILVVGGATGQIGDPTGKTEMRQVLKQDVIVDNKTKLKNMLEKYISFEGENAAIIVDNYEWMKDYTFINFMRDIGTHFNVNSMLKTDIYKNRLEEGGLTFFEMSYMLLQAYDFVELKQRHNCRMQLGGTDQWVNILAGTTLNRKLYPEDEELIALTVPLLTTADGVKMGKTAGNALWIDEKKLSPYEFYQAFINMEDRDVKKLLLLFSELSLDEIDELVNSDIRVAKDVMAHAVCMLVHGKEKADLAQKTSKEVFSKGESSNMPTLKVEFPVNILDVLTESDLAKSKSDARRLIEQGGIKVDDEVIEDVDFEIKKEVIIQKGKKNYLKVI